MIILGKISSISLPFSPVLRSDPVCLSTSAFLGTLCMVTQSSRTFTPSVLVNITRCLASRWNNPSDLLLRCKDGVVHFDYPSGSAITFHSCDCGHSEADLSTPHRKERTSSPPWSYPAPTLGECPLYQYPAAMVVVYGMASKVW